MLLELNTKNSVTNIKSNNFTTDSNDGQELDLKQIDTIVQLVIKLLEKLSENFKIDLFLILIERMTFNRPSLLTCSLIDSIHENVSPILINYSEKSIKFVINTFQRVAEQTTIVLRKKLKTDNDFIEMKQNSLTICLQIIKILIKERHKLKDKDIRQMIELIPSLNAFSKNKLFDENMRKTVIELKNQIELYEKCINISINSSELQNEFESAMTELNDPLMPVRAHALIKLKQLIYAKDKHLLANKDQLINASKGIHYSVY